MNSFFTHECNIITKLFLNIIDSLTSKFNKYMNYPKTIDILWGRINGGLNSNDYSNWATNLMINGIENEDIIYLASNNDLHWQDVENYFSNIILYLGINHIEKPIDMYVQIENELLFSYNINIQRENMDKIRKTANYVGLSI